MDATGTLSTGSWPDSPGRRSRRNALGRRIVAYMVLASALLSVVAAGVQLYLSYERDRARVLKEFSVVENSFLDGLENALWHFNFSQIEVLLDGIHAQADVVHLKLEAKTGQSWTRGDAADTKLVIRHFELTHEGRPDDEALVGTLAVGISLAPLRQRIWAQFVTLALSNFLKTLVAAFIMLAIFDRLAARHIRAITRQLSASSWNEGFDTIRLDRPESTQADDLENIVATLNGARDAARRAHTELDTAARDLKVANARLQDANREQAEFTYAISHDLKSPANTVSMLTDELLSEEAGRLSDDGKETLSDIRRTVDRMSRLVEDVLVYSRTVGGEHTPERVNVNELIAEIQEDLKSDIEEAGAAIEVGVLPVVWGNPMQLRMLFQNLIANAVKFREPDRPVKVRISAQRNPDTQTVSFSVADNGIGIAPEYHDRIFGLFQRLHTASRFGGSGLGLTICRRIASNHGGELSVKSEPGVGTTFTATLQDIDDGHAN